MIPDSLKKAILNESLLFRASRFIFSEVGVGNDEGETDAEFLIIQGKFRAHFEVHGINERYISPNFLIDNKKKTVHEDPDRIEIEFDWKPSKNPENEPISMEYFIEGNNVTAIKFWFFVGPDGHYRTITFIVNHIQYCNQCYNTYEIDFMSEENICPECGNVTRITR